MKICKVCGKEHNRQVGDYCSHTCYGNDPSNAIYEMLKTANETKPETKLSVNETKVVQDETKLIQSETKVKCLFCGVPLETKDTGRPKIYCSPRCRLKHWRNKE